MVHYADQTCWYRSQIVQQQEVAKDTFRVRIQAPEIAQRAMPGQFVMVRVAGCNDPLIGRALAVFDRYSIDGEYQGIDLVYVAKGKFTSLVKRLQAGQELELWGPLGNTFSTDPVDRLIMVAGGVGETPMLALGREALGSEQYGDRPSGFAEEAILCYGARTASLLACVDDFRSANIDVRLSTDDGTAGSKQLVTATLQEVIAESRRDGKSMRIACCGPEPMMKAVSKIAIDAGIPCEVSLETPMACGIGICFTCVAKVVHESGWDFKRTCVEGPIFQAETLVW